MDDLAKITSVFPELKNVVAFSMFVENEVSSPFQFIELILLTSGYDRSGLTLISRWDMLCEPLVSFIEPRIPPTLAQGY